MNSLAGDVMVLFAIGGVLALLAGLLFLIMVMWSMGNDD